MINSVNPINFKGYSNIENVEQELECPCCSEPEAYTYLYEDDECFDKFTKAAGVLDNVVETEDVKTPYAVGASIAGAGLHSFTKGAAIGASVDKVSGNRISNTVETGLRKASDIVKVGAKKLSENNGKSYSRVLNTCGKTLSKAEEFARKAYNSLATVQVKETIENGVENVVKTVKKHSAARAFTLFSGAAAAFALVPGLLKKDANEDGVADIMQKSQNVYAANSKTMDDIQRKTSVFTELMQILT